MIESQRLLTETKSEKVIKISSYSKQLSIQVSTFTIQDSTYIPVAILLIHDDFPAKALPSTHARIGKGGNSGGGGGVCKHIFKIYCKFYSN